MLDGFSRYNQVLVAADDRLKTCLTTTWGNLMYMRILFGLMNARSTFQRVMDYAFVYIIFKKWGES